MSCCPYCYETSPLCPRAGDPTATCCNFTPLALDVRTGEGSYGPEFRNTLHPVARNADAGHIDQLVGYSVASAGPEALNAEEQTVVDDWSNLNDGNLDVAVRVVEKRLSLLKKARARLDVLASSATGPKIQAITYYQGRLNQIDEEARRDREKPKVTTPEAFSQQEYPMATLMQRVIKGVVKDADVQEDTREMFDPSSGKKFVPFAKATKAEDGVQLMYCVHVFAQTLQSMARLAPKALFDFTRDVSRVIQLKGHKFGQEYIDAILRKVDEKVYANIVSLYRAGEHNKIHDQLVTAAAKPKPKPGGGPPGQLGGPNGKINFGPVSTPLGGLGAGWIKTKCNRFHANPQRECTAGIPPNEGFPEHLVGLCAYTHEL